MKTKKTLKPSPAEATAKPAAKPRKKAEKKKVCSIRGCKKPIFAQTYCRMCYITNWKHIKFDRQVKAERRLNAYIDRLSKKYPKDYLEIIKEGLEDESKFKQTAQELNLDVEEPSETDTEFLEKFMRSVKISE